MTTDVAIGAHHFGIGSGDAPQRRIPPGNRRNTFGSGHDCSQSVVD
jgi:hypothetical protein